MAESGKDVRRQYDELAFDNFFQRFNLTDLKEAFTENGFRTCRSLMIVSDDDLKEIGIASLGLRKEVLGAVEEWKKPLLQRAGSSTQGDRIQKSEPTSPSTSQPPTLSAQPTNRPSQEYKPSPHSQIRNPSQYTSPNISRIQDHPSPGTPTFLTGPSPASPGVERFHRIKRNESCPYPECTWAGLSTHFHCLVCSNFHTNKTERIRRHIQRHDHGPENASDLDEYQRVKREHFFIFGGKECPEQCKYSEQGVRHLHCKHCDWRTKKMERVRKHLKAHNEEPFDVEANQRQEEYYQVKDTHFKIYNRLCPEMCKYAHQGIRHIHCKHCEWTTQKFDSRLLAHFKSHHERMLLQYQNSGQELGSPATTMSSIRTVSPLPTMAVQEAVQIADAQAANHDGTGLARPPKLMKMETPDGERAVAVHIQQGSYLGRPSINSEDEGTESSHMLEGEVAQHSNKYKCMVCGETQGLRSALMREQKGRNGPVDWSKTKQLFAYHRTKTTQPAIHWICQKHIEEFVYFSRAYLGFWSTAGVHQQSPAQPHHHPQQQHQHHQQEQQQHQQEQHRSPSPENEAEVNETTLVSGMPVYMMLNEHLNEQFKREAGEPVAEE